jgi:hypothetical protein
VDRPTGGGAHGEPACRGEGTRTSSKRPRGGVNGKRWALAGAASAAASDLSVARDRFVAPGGPARARARRHRRRKIAPAMVSPAARRAAQTSRRPRVSASVLRFVVLLTLSNVFMTFAWYAHLKHLNERKWFVAALVSWGIALFEYLLQVPANRIGYTTLRLDQLKVVQEVITLAVFVPFAVFYMRQPVRIELLWAGLCLVGAVYFIFKP